ncbi:MAG TPA: hypothetical protein VFV88_14855 [Steroidobacteraceae bacterium]|jgi:hypothetical protein|nr:hypothetical protein [Steroidobacteraceae bacterium]
MKIHSIAGFAGAMLVMGFLGGCASYMTPGGGVSIPEITTPNVADAMSRQPAAVFPARLAVVRVQGAGYESYSNRGYGRGRYSVITNRDIETEADFTRLAAMPEVSAVGPVNRLLLPETLNSSDDLRVAAAQLQADIVMLYTIDTSFRTDTQQIGPMQLVSLGFFPNKKAKVSSTCAVAFIDTRTGYVYGVAESTANEEQRSDLWNKEEAIEKARAKAERTAFAQALGDVEKLWAQIAARATANRGAGGGAPPASP